MVADTLYIPMPACILVSLTRIDKHVANCKFGSGLLMHNEGHH